MAKCLKCGFDEYGNFCRQCGTPIPGKCAQDALVKAPTTGVLQVGPVLVCPNCEHQEDIDYLQETLRIGKSIEDLHEVFDDSYVEAYHGVGFWGLVDQMCEDDEEDYRQLEGELRENTEGDLCVRLFDKLAGGRSHGKVDCPGCNARFRYTTARIRAKRSRGSKRENTRHFSIRVVRTGVGRPDFREFDDIVEFTNASYEDFELRARDKVTLSYLGSELRAIQNNTIHMYMTVVTP